MNTYDLITKTKNHIPLTDEEIYYLVDGYTNGAIPDYQVSAWLMAVCLNSLTPHETAILTKAMRDSGETLDLSGIKGVSVDKHSTGGVGDKTSLIIAPIVAACGGYVPKMSGKGLGHTGGTIDKLESIPNFNTQIPFNEFIDIINENGFAIISQSGHLVPADKKLYALRDATATVDSIPLICSSIMSKKLATGADCIVLDVKTGSGAFMKTLPDTQKLASLMVETAKKNGKKCRAVITDMDTPLGMAVGTSVEVIEAMEILKGKQKDRLYRLCTGLAAHMLEISGIADFEKAVTMAEKAIEDGTALEKFKNMVRLQGGNENITDDYSLFAQPGVYYEVKATESKYICKIDSQETGLVSLMLGAGRRTKESSIDYSAGIIFKHTVGEYVEKGETIAVLQTSTDCNIKEIAERCLKAFKFSEEKPEEKPVIISVE